MPQLGYRVTLLCACSRAAGSKPAVDSVLYLKLVGGEEEEDVYIVAN